MAKPVDPDSPQGIALAERLTEVFAEVWLNIQARKAAAEFDALQDDDCLSA